MVASRLDLLVGMFQKAMILHASKYLVLVFSIVRSDLATSEERMPQVLPRDS